MKPFAMSLLATLSFSTFSTASPQKARLNEQFLSCLTYSQKAIAEEVLEKRHDTKLLQKTQVVNYLINELTYKPDTLTKGQAEHLESEIFNELNIECSIRY